MKGKIIKYSIILFSIVFAIRVVTIFTADRLYSMSLGIEQGAGEIVAVIAMVNSATKLDSTNADLYFIKYELLKLKTKTDIRKQQLHLLKKCIDLCPSWPEYHIYYAYALKQMSLKPNIVTKELILSELKKATELKPYSPTYKKLYDKHLTHYE